ncbi:unnamed protein product, partial [Staurois parvus]
APTSTCKRRCQPPSQGSAHPPPPPGAEGYTLAPSPTSSSQRGPPSAASLPPNLGTQQAAMEFSSDDRDGGSPPRCLTLAQRASRHRLSRVARSILELLLVEENMLQHLPLDHQFTMQIKDSIEFRNICIHMALQTDDRRFDQDLNSAQECLTQIIANMTWDTSSKTCDFCYTAQEQLKQILQKLQD